MLRRFNFLVYTEECMVVVIATFKHFFEKIKMSNRAHDELPDNISISWRLPDYSSNYIVLRLRGKLNSRGFNFIIHCWAMWSLNGKLMTKLSCILYIWPLTYYLCDSTNNVLLCNKDHYIAQYVKVSYEELLLVAHDDIFVLEFCDSPNNLDR